MPLTKIPALKKLSKSEVDCVIAMFNFYDIEKSGKIDMRYAKRIIIDLGFPKISRDIYSPFISLSELLLFLDFRIENNQLLSGLRIVSSDSTIDLDGEKRITGKSLRSFLSSIDRALSEELCDFCIDLMSHEAYAIKPEHFEKAVLKYADR